MCYYENIRSDDNKNAESQLLQWNKKKVNVDMCLATV